MKTILVNYTGKKGGGAQYAYEMTNAFVKSNYKVIAVLSDKLENIELWKKLNIEEIIYVPTYNGYISFLIALFKLVLFKEKYRRLIKKYQIDYIYIPMEQPFTKIVNGLVRKPYILTVHDVTPHSGDNLITKLIGDLLNLGIRKNANFVVLLSNKFVNEYSVKYKYSKDKILVVKHGFFTSLISQTITKMEISNLGKTNFVFFGRITEYKGIDVLLNAYNQYFSENDNISLTIVGSGSIEKYESIIKETKKINIINRWVSDSEIMSFFSIPNTVVVLPYKDATQSGVISLAHMYKVPVIATNTGGLSEQITHNKTGILVNPNDPHDLLKAMRAICNGIYDTQKITETAFITGNNLWQVGVSIIENAIYRT